MPVANIHVLKGHPREALQRMVVAAAEAMARSIEAPVERLQVWVTEVDPGLYAYQGATAEVAMAERGRAAVEIPFIRMSLLEGRPLEKMQKAMAEMSAVVAHHLDADPARVRVQIDLVAPERWGIGGRPASEVRAAEIAARAALAPKV